MSGNRFGDVSGYFNRLTGGYFKRFRRSAPPAPDERTATIERLEQALADERDDAAALQRTVDDLTFQIEVLEKGYAKQLEDARQRTEEAERSLAERGAALEDVNARHEAAAESLAGARDELQRVTAQRDQLRRQIDGDPEPDDAADGAQADLPEGTINRLLTEASRPRVKRREPSPAEAGEDEAVSGEMLSPELLFRNKEADDS
jgi:predicted ribosome quality control (RQC) complex YloA/Tae2 family protein